MIDYSKVMILTLSDTGVSVTFNGAVGHYSIKGILKLCVGDESDIPSHLKVVDKRSAVTTKVDTN
ncbi:hypothetical protein [Xenorhabdus bovienii]|uniref:hypothetical protein n=1 Tax=Xenorhabdus bovienii TaxID=40576 RepID=UPI0023B2362E|nr:hypothetical protein [Xenorhabdus bovienii]MDE9427806.1 hypothetical protein [Xenorhabdus bovienii]